MVVVTYMMIQMWLLDLSIGAFGNGNPSVVTLKKIMFVVVVVYMVLIYGDFGMVMALNHPQEKGRQ